MIKYLKQLAGDSIIYGLSSVVTRFVSLLLIPIYTKIFVPADYGVINLVNVTFYLVGIFVVFGLDNSVAIWFWQKPDENNRKRTFSTWFWFQNVLSILFCLIFVVFSKQISKAILSNEQYYALFMISGISLPFLSTHRIIQNWYRYQRKAIPTVIFTTLVSVGTILFTLFFVVYLRIGVIGVFYAQLVTALIGFVYFLITMREGWYGLRYFNTQYLKEMLKFAYPLIPAAISYWLMSSAGSFFLEKYCDKTEVGLFQIGISFAGIVNMVIMAFNQAWPPFAISISREEGHQKVYSNVYLLYIVFGSLFSTLVWIFAPELLHVFTQPAYYSANLVLGILAFNVFISGITSIITIGPNLVKNNKPYGIAVILASAISVALYFILIPLLKKEGAALATLAGNIFVVLFVAIKAQKLYFIPYKWLQSLKYVITGLIAVLGSFLLEGLLFKILLTLIYVTIIFLFSKELVVSMRLLITQEKQNDV